MSNNRETIYKKILKEYLRKANANQKPKVKELLNSYKSGEIFSKVTMRKQLNSYLNTRKDDTIRDLQFLQLNVKNISNIGKPIKESKKFEATLKKFEHVKRYRENYKFVKVVKINDESFNGKPMKSYNMQLNTKMAFPAKIFKLFKEGDQDTLKTYDYKPDRMDENKMPHNDTIYLHIKQKVERVLTYRLIDVLKENKSIKVSVGMKFDTFIIKNSINEVEGTSILVYQEEKLIAKTKATAINQGNIVEKINELNAELEEKIDNAMAKLEGSGWHVKQYHTLFIEVYKIKEARGASYIPTPVKYSNPKCGLVNIRNDDNECFKWCMKYHQSEKKKHDDRVTVLSKLEDRYNYEGISFPVSYDDIKKFEINNECCIFIYRINDEGGITKERDGNFKYYGKDLIYLLRLEDGNKSHYIYIKNISRLLNLIKNSDDKERRYCPYCQNNILNTKFERHISSCFKIAKEGSILKMPDEGDVMKFKNYKNTLERPFIVYADTETTNVKLNDKNKLTKHVVNSCAYYFVCTFDNSRNYYRYFVGENCIIDMIKDLNELSKQCIDEMRKNEKMELSKEDKKEFYNADKCYLCGECFGEKGLAKVRDHNHRTGKYRGACHNKCNINYFSNRYLPIVFHNLRGYDGHIIIKEAFNIGNDNISAIPNSFEKFMTIKIGNLKFIDSMQFLNTSLEKLTENLYCEKPKFDSDGLYGRTFDKYEIDFRFVLKLCCG